MQRLSIDKVMNQQFSFNADKNLWLVTLTHGQTSTLVSVNINNVEIVTAIRAVSDTPILFNTFLGRFGNLVFSCGDDVVPDHTKFDESHILYYLSPGEL